jgi:hypothetical protein
VGPALQRNVLDIVEPLVKSRFIDVVTVVTLDRREP